MKRALIDGSRVCQVVNAGDEFPVAPGLAWVDCEDGADSSEAWEYAGGVVKMRAQTKAEENAPAIVALADIDRRSIRGIREFIVKKYGLDPDLPETVKTLDKAAASERAKLKP